MSQQIASSFWILLFAFCLLSSTTVRGAPINKTSPQSDKGTSDEEIWTKSGPISSHLRLRRVLNTTSPRNDENNALYNPHSKTTPFGNVRGPGDSIPFFMGDGTPYTYIDIGTPPQKASVVLDTGSHLLWIHGAKTSFLGSKYTYNESNSSSWKSENQRLDIGYLDSGRCTIQQGAERVVVAGKEMHMSVGIADTTNCVMLPSILGLDPRSDFLKAFIREYNDAPKIFSFNMNANMETTRGGWFSIGSYAGLDPSDIIWITSTRPGKAYQIPLPYVSYDSERFEFEKDHGVIIDTGSNIGVLPDKVLTPLFEKVAGRTTVRSHGYLSGSTVFNLSSVPPELYPTMAMRLGDMEWLTEIVNERGILEENYYTPQEYQNFSLPNYISDKSLMARNGFKESDWIPSILGSPFWSNLKGLVFDFTPGKERVGLIPRVKIVPKDGIISPLSPLGGANNEAVGKDYIVIVVGVLVGILTIGGLSALTWALYIHYCKT